MEKVEACLTIDYTEQVGRRVDQVIADSELPLSRSRLKAQNAEIYCNDRRVKVSHLTKLGDKVRILYVPEPDTTLTAQKVEFGIIYEDDDVLVVNKPRGLVVHPGSGNFNNTLAHGLLFHHQYESQDSSSIDPSSNAVTADAVTTNTKAWDDENQHLGPNQRAGIVHRLDKDTSGILITAKNTRALEFMQREFSERRTEKRYLALSYGIPPRKKGQIDSRILRHPQHRTVFTTDPKKGREACTEYRVVREFHLFMGPAGNPEAAGPVQKGGKRAGPVPARETCSYALLALRPITGRTHQLRVHLASQDCPILGDPLYAARQSTRDPNFPEVPLMLHAYSLGIRLPGSGVLRVFRAPVPEDMLAVISKLRTRHLQPTET